MKIKNTFVVVYDMFSKDIVYMCEYSGENYSICCAISDNMNKCAKQNNNNKVYYLVEIVSEIDYENN